MSFTVIVIRRLMGLAVLLIVAQGLRTILGMLLVRQMRVDVANVYRRDHCDREYASLGAIARAMAQNIPRDESRRMNS